MRPLPNPIGLGISFLVLALIFLVLQKLSPGQRGQSFFRRGFGLDLIYWFFTPLISGLISRIAIIMTALPLIIVLGLSWKTFQHHGYHGFGPLSRQPLWLQGVEIFVLGDLMSYWMHRLFHGRALWPFHAVHHCSTDVDWLSSVRLHPLNEAVTRSVEVIPLFLTGFNPGTLAAYIPLITLYALFLHANVNWSFGSLRYVIASPVFHRWHHSKEPEAIDKNFAGFVAFWDVLFGTFYVPKDKVPVNFGVSDPIPESLWGQLTHPFRQREHSS
jgi:sterol desaturase/sphingolipid hydroxylase (fatty acid hydroxylase superfamily)